MKNLKIHLWLPLFLFALPVQANLPDPVKEFARDSFNLQRLEAYKQNYQKLIDTYQIQTLIAISYYPELKNAKIRFREKNIKTTMASIPRMDFIFHSKRSRTYHIYIDNSIKKGKGLLLRDIPFNAQIGVIGHELGHLSDYEDRTAVGIVILGIGYLFPPFHRKLEHKVDEITIAHGLGYQVEAFSDFVFNQAAVNDRYRKFKSRYYYDPRQLTRLLEKYPIY